MVRFIDRRLNSKNKSMVNRQRFVRRYKSQIKKSLAENVAKRSITDHLSDENVNIPNKDISEPQFSLGEGGSKDKVLPGNDQFQTGDKISRPPSGGGQGAGGGSSDQGGQHEDDFLFSISADEYLNLLFDDLELPDLQANQYDQMIDYKTVRSGYTKDGVPANIDIVRSMQDSMARRIAMNSSKRKELKACQAKLAELLNDGMNLENPQIIALQNDIDELKAKIAKTPFIDSFDLQYRNYAKQAIPLSKAVMFCLMDVSGSMLQPTKDMAKRFYILMYLFLSRHYKEIDVVYIIHHTQAKEVDEHEFFYSKETGGTIVSSALKLMLEIIEQRYSDNEWNLYAVQASDGDNWQEDILRCHELLQQKILPMLRYYSYIEINSDPPKALWHQYQKLQSQYHNFAMQQIKQADDIYPVFRKLFKKHHNLTAFME